MISPRLRLNWPRIGWSRDFIPRRPGSQLWSVAQDQVPLSHFRSQVCEPHQSPRHCLMHPWFASAPSQYGLFGCLSQSYGLPIQTSHPPLTLFRRVTASNIPQVPTTSAVGQYFPWSNLWFLQYRCLSSHCPDLLPWFFSLCPPLPSFVSLWARRFSMPQVHQSSADLSSIWTLSCLSLVQSSWRR